MKKKHLAIAAAVLAGGIVAYRVYSPSRRQPAPAPEAHQPAGAVPEPAAAALPAFGRTTKTSDCLVNGSLPDPACTPGDIIATETKAVICDPGFRTSTVRDSVTTPAQKSHVYAMYNIAHPQHNQGADQVCEIDHLVSLELGGNDTMANLWPQCSPGYAGWTGASFHDKDGFENHLRKQVCSEQMTLTEAQRQIATDWHKFWVEAGKPTR